VLYPQGLRPESALVWCTCGCGGGSDRMGVPAGGGDVCRQRFGLRLLSYSPLFSLSPTESGDWSWSLSIWCGASSEQAVRIGRLRAAEADQRRGEAEASRDELRMLATNRPRYDALRHWSRVRLRPRSCFPSWQRNWRGVWA